MIDIVEGRQRLATQKQFKELRENIQRHGLIHPIVVRPVKAGRFELVAGHHRLLALKELGFATVPVNMSAISDDLVDLHAFYSNLLAPELCEFEKYQRLKHRMLMTGLTQEGVAEEAGISRQYVGLLLCFDSLDERLRSLIEHRPIGFGTKLALLVKHAALISPTETESALQQYSADQSQSTTQLKTILEKVIKPTSAPAPPPMTHKLRQGRKTLAELRARDGVITYTFSAGGADETKRRFDRIKQVMEVIESECQ